VSECLAGSGERSGNEGVVRWAVGLDARRWCGSVTVQYSTVMQVDACEVSDLQMIYGERGKSSLSLISTLGT